MKPRSGEWFRPILPEISVIGYGEDYEPAVMAMEKEAQWVLTVKLKPPMQEKYLWAQVTITPEALERGVEQDEYFWSRLWNEVGKQVFEKLGEKNEVK
jgi:hypothetical protein